MPLYFIGLGLDIQSIMFVKRSLVALGRQISKASSTSDSSDSDTSSEERMHKSHNKRVKNKRISLTVPEIRVEPSRKSAHSAQSTPTERNISRDDMFRTSSRSTNRGSECSTPTKQNVSREDLFRSSPRSSKRNSAPPPLTRTTSVIKEKFLSLSSNLNIPFEISRSKLHRATPILENSISADVTSEKACLSVGFLGFGTLGKYIYSELLCYDNIHTSYILCHEKIGYLSSKTKVISSVDEMTKTDLIIEIDNSYLLEVQSDVLLYKSNLFITSTDVFAYEDFAFDLLSMAKGFSKACVVSKHDLLGVTDISKLAQTGCIESINIKVSKHPKHAYLGSEHKDIDQSNERIARNKKQVIYNGSVKSLSKMSPKEAEPMIIYALATGYLKLSEVTCQVEVDPSIGEMQRVQVRVKCEPNETGYQPQHFTDTTYSLPSSDRKNMVKYEKIFNSLLLALESNLEPGIHVL